MRDLKDILYIGESNVVYGNPSPFVSQYRDLANVNARMERAVVNYGGTVPSPLVP
jgi:hypothetical protein